MNRFLTENDVAELTKISLATLRRWRLARKGPKFHKFGSLVRYDENELEEWRTAQPVGGDLRQQLTQHERTKAEVLRNAATEQRNPGRPSTDPTMYEASRSITPAKKGGKIVRSFSISPESASFIRRMCRERSVCSESEMLEILLREFMAIRERNVIDAAYSEYYDSLTESEISEQQAWGAFSESQMERKHQ